MPARLSLSHSILFSDLGRHENKNKKSAMLRFIGEATCPAMPERRTMCVCSAGYVT